MNDQEIEDQIWEKANAWINKSCLCDDIPTNKKRCFDIMKLMIPMQLRERTVKNTIEVVRIDTSKRAEFEFGLTFQKNLLKDLRDKLSKYPKPIFFHDHTITHYIPPLIIGNLTVAQNRKRCKEFNENPKFRKQFKIDEEIKVWKTRKSKAKSILEAMRFYYTGILVIMSRSLLQKSLGIISTKEANIRIKKCEKVLEVHFKTMLKENPKDHEAIRQFHEVGYMFQNPIYNLGKFRI